MITRHQFANAVPNSVACVELPRPAALCAGIFLTGVAPAAIERVRLLCNAHQMIDIRDGVGGDGWRVPACEFMRANGVLRKDSSPFVDLSGALLNSFAHVQLQVTLNEIAGTNTCLEAVVIWAGSLGSGS